MKRLAVVSATAVFPLLIILNCASETVAAISVIAFIVMLVIAKILKNKLFTVVSLFCIAASLSMLCYMHFGVNHDAAYDGINVQLCGVVEQKYYDGKYRIKPTQIKGENAEIKLNGDIVLWDFDEQLLNEKDIISVSVRLNVNTKSYGFGKSGYMDGAYLNAYPCEEISVTGKEEVTFFDFSYNLRAYIHRVCQKIGDEEGGLVLSLLTGNKTMLSKETVQAFTACGLSHIMAVSGMHLSVITGVAVFLLDKAEVERRTRQILCVLVVFFVMTAAVYSFSVMRAGIMNIILVLAYCLGRRANSINSLGVAITLICIANPFSVFDAGFLLSVSATLGILLIMPFINKPLRKIRFKPLKWLVTGAAVCLCATAGVLPVASILFMEISAVGLLLSPLTIFFVSALIILGIACSIVWFIPFVSVIFTFPATIIARIFIKIVYFFSGLRFSVVGLSAPPLILFALFGLILCAVMASEIKKKIRKPIIAIACLCVFAVSVAFSVRPYSTECTIVAGEAKGGQYVVAHSENAFTVVDCTNEHCADDILEYMDSQNIKKIDVLLMPEYSEGRVDAMKHIMNYKKPKKIILPDIAHNYKYGIIKQVKNLHSNVHIVDSGKAYTCNGITVSLCENTGCIAPYVHYKDFACAYLPESIENTNAIKADMLICSKEILNSTKATSSAVPEYALVYGATKGEISSFRLQNTQLKAAGVSERSVVAVNEKNFKVGREYEY